MKIEQRIISVNLENLIVKVQEMENIKKSESAMAYKNATIYFWSGTGNSFRVASWMAEEAENRGINSQLISIDKCEPLEDIKPGSDNLLAIVFPTHGFTSPWHMLKFVWKLPRRNGAHAVTVATRAGMKFGAVFPPGISGSAIFVISLILLLKGYSIRGLMSIDMPSNWFSLHPIQSRKTHEAIISRNQRKVSRFIQGIYSNKKVLFNLNILYEFTWGTLLSLISVLYLLIGRFFLAKLFFSNNNCEGCGVCAKSCSPNAIKMWGKDPRPFWKYNCESCMRCAAFCPKNAIEAGHSWGVLAYFIISLPISVWLFSWLGDHIPSIASIDSPWMHELVNILYFYPSIFLSYLIFFGLLKIPFINWVFTRTTLTNYWGRYKEPGTKLKNIAPKKMKKK